MKSSYRNTSLFFIALLVAFVLIAQFSFTKNNTELSPSAMQWVVPQIPAEMSFSGEEVPLHKREIREQFDREWNYIYYNQSSNIYVLKLAERYFPVIEERLKKNGIPDDFKYLCIAESNLQNLISRAGAVGFWQFMKETAPAYDLEVSASVDERYNVLKSTDAACAYLQTAYNKFGSWTAAAASYNCGMGGYNSRATAQHTKNYYDLYLPEETNRYMFRILSFKHLISNAKALGYNLPDTATYKPIHTRAVTINSTIANLPSYANQHGISYKTLRILNPWIRGYSLPVKTGKSYELLLPADE